MQLWCECHGCFHSTLWRLSQEYLWLSCRLWHHLMWRGKYYLLLSILWSRKLSEIHWFLLIFSLKMEPWTELSFFHRLNIMIAMELSRVLKGWWSFSSSLSLELWWIFWNPIFSLKAYHRKREHKGKIWEIWQLINCHCVLCTFLNILWSEKLQGHTQRWKDWIPKRVNNYQTILYSQFLEYLFYVSHWQLKQLYFTLIIGQHFSWDKWSKISRFHPWMRLQYKEALKFMRYLW